MMTVTIEGPAGCGKTRLSTEIVLWCASNGLSTISLDDGNQRHVADLPKADVLIVEKQTVGA